MNCGPKTAGRLRPVAHSALLLLLAACAPGCVFVPTGEWPDGVAADFRPLVGPADSDRPIRPGAVSRERVVELLGKPPRTEAGGAVIAYEMWNVKGVFLSPLAHFGGSLYHRHYLFLRFDSGGTLAAYRRVDQPYFDDNKYDYETELRRFIADTDPAPRAGSR